MAIRKFAGAGIVIAAAVALAGCAPADSPEESPASVNPPTAKEVEEALSTPTTLTYWGWDLSAPASVEAFEKLHPAITIDYVNAGVATPEYQKLRTALAAGSGVPDVVFMEGAIISSFAQTDSLLDLTTMGAASLEADFVPAAWGPVALGDQVLGLPVGANLVASFYRADLFQAAGITEPPTTWADFAAAAKALKETTGAAIANIPANDPSMLLNAFFQAGTQPFGWEPGSSTVSIHLNSPEMKEVADYWDDLLQSDYVSSVPGWGDAFYQAVNADNLATWQAGVWASPVLADSTTTSGKWRVSSWPQWNTDENEGAIWAGGIADVVMDASENKIAAYEFIKFRATDEAFAREKAYQFGWDPVLTSMLEDPEWLVKTDPFTGDQEVNRVFADVLKNVGPVWHYPPFMEFIYSSFTDTVGTAAVEKTGLSASLDAWQDIVVNYAEQQGFTVE